MNLTELTIYSEHLEGFLKAVEFTQDIKVENIDKETMKGYNGYDVVCIIISYNEEYKLFHLGLNYGYMIKEFWQK